MRASLRLDLLACVLFLCVSLVSPRPHPRSYISSPKSSSISSLSSFNTIRSENGFSTDPATGITKFTPPGNTTVHDFGARQVSPFTIVGILVDVVKVVNNLFKILSEDKEARGEYTKMLVTRTRDTYPFFNVVACHGPHDFKWEGVEGKDWLHMHKEFDVKAGGPSGTRCTLRARDISESRGRGWAYGGNILSTGAGGATVNFGPYATPRGKLVGVAGSDSTSASASTSTSTPNSNTTSTSDSGSNSDSGSDSDSDWDSE
ncbi:hypothetical protein BD779DRAFT_1678023 [Infundibulicybe gibba]|nr:hypothetical protein BD779DRAFT_1678023 [Infundibulicybe gibba]